MVAVAGATPLACSWTFFACWLTVLAGFVDICVVDVDADDGLLLPLAAVEFEPVVTMIII